MDSVYKNSGIIGITAAGGAVLGFFLQLIVAYYFGAGATTDAFFMAQSTSELLGKLLMGGSITAVFIPLFVHRLTKGKKEDAFALGLNLVNIMACVYVLFIAFIWIFSGTFIHIIAPGFTGNTYTLTVSLLKVLLPSFLFLFLLEFATSMLHSLKEFALPAYLRLIQPIISIVSILLLVRYVGIYALAIGILIGSVVQLAIVGWGLTVRGMRYRFFINLKDPALRDVVRLVYPFIFSILVTQAAGIVYRMIVSTLEESSLSALKYAEKITQLITIIFLNSVTLAIYPLLSEKAHSNDSAGMKDTIANSLRLIVFFTLPIILAVALLRRDIISFLYQRGSFSSQDALYTSIALLYLVLGLTTNGISSILGHAVLALQKTKAAVIITIASQVVAITLFMMFTPRMGFAGLALASSLVPLSSALLYFLYLGRFIPALHTIFVHITYVKIIILSGISSLLIWCIMQLQLPSIAQMMISLAVGSLFYLACAHMWHIEEMRQISDIFRRKFQKITL
ncbi:MAG: murein biosynthesis integral membrane protein MurJ [Patescibacteria group bacterium]